MPRDIAPILRWTLIAAGGALIVLGLFTLGIGKQHAMMRRDFGYALVVGLACAGSGIGLWCLAASRSLDSVRNPMLPGSQSRSYLAGCWLRWTSRARS